MISSLRRKRQTIAAPNMLARTAVNLMGVALLLAGAAAFAQETGTSAPEPARVLHFTKPPNSPVIPGIDSHNRNGKSVTPKVEANRDVSWPRSRVSPSRTDPALRPTAFQAQPREGSMRAADEPQEYQVQLEP